jgi:hypothetical protein
VIGAFDALIILVAGFVVEALNRVLIGSFFSAAMRVRGFVKLLNAIRRQTLSLVHGN